MAWRRQTSDRIRWDARGKADMIASSSDRIGRLEPYPLVASASEKQFLASLPSPDPLLDPTSGIGSNDQPSSERNMVWLGVAFLVPRRAPIPNS